MLFSPCLKQSSLGLDLVTSSLPLMLNFQYLSPAKFYVTARLGYASLLNVLIALKYFAFCNYL